MYEEQWDIYKLDPAYECVFFAAPGRPIIRLKGESSEEHPTQPAYDITVEEPPLQPAASRVRGQSVPDPAVGPPHVPEEMGQARGRQSMEVDEQPTTPGPSMTHGQPPTTLGPSMAHGQPPTTPGAGMAHDQPVEDATIGEQQSRHEQGQARGQSMEIDEPPLRPESGVVRGQSGQGAAVGEQQIRERPGQDHGRQSTQVQNPPLSEKLGPKDKVSGSAPDSSICAGSKATGNAEQQTQETSLPLLNSQSSDGVGSSTEGIPNFVGEKRKGGFTMNY